MTLWYLSCFLSGSVQFFLFTLLFFVSVLISSLWRGPWRGIFQLCCCRFSAIVYSLSLNVSDQVRVGTVPARGRGTAQYTLGEGGGLPASAREWLTLVRHSPWLWLIVLRQEWGILANQITATGWSHRQRSFTQLTCNLFYCQIIMTILANITKEIVTDYSFTSCQSLQIVTGSERTTGRQRARKCRQRQTTHYSSFFLNTFIFFYFFLLLCEHRKGEVWNVYMYKVRIS